MAIRRTSALQTLHDQLVAVNTDISILSSPVEEIDDLLGNIGDLLKEPKKIDDDLGDLEDVLKPLQKLASEADWIPEIGEDATAVANALNVANDAISEIRRILGQIDKVLEKPIKWIEKAKSPVDRVVSSIHVVELEVTRFEAGSERLIEHFGSNPPKNVEACAADLSSGISPVVSALDSAKDKAVAALNEAERPLRTVEAELSKISHYADIVQKIYQDLAWLRTTARQIAKTVNKAESYSKKTLEALLTTKFPRKIYNELMNDLQAGKRLLSRMESKVTSYALSPIREAAREAESALAKEIQNLPDVTPLEAAAAEVIAEFRRIEDAVTNDLSAACADILCAGPDQD